MLPRSHYKLLEAARQSFPAERPAGRVLAAVSGGSDSMALLALLAAARERDDFDLTAVYVNHGLRVASAFEAAVVCATATSVSARFEYASCAPAPAASEEGLREARYAALARVARRCGADWIATGHTRDDQIETILFRFLRGSGRAGLAGIPRARACTEAGLTESPHTRTDIVRPLLALGRNELRAFLRDIGWGWTEDASNRDRRHVRNRIRHVVIPTIERELGRGRLEHLPQVANLWAREDAFLETEAARFAAYATRGASGPLWLDLVAFETAPAALRPRVLRRWLHEAGFDHEPGLAKLDAIERLALGRDGSGEVSINGVRVVREYSRLRLEARSTASSFSFPVRADAAADYVDPAGEWALSVDPQPRNDAPAIAVAGFQVVEFLKEAVSRSLVLRSRVAGDTIRIGHRGTRKVHDIMVEMHVPKRVRQTWPVLASDEKVIWVPGLAVCADMESASSSTRAQRVRFAWRRM